MVFESYYVIVVHISKSLVYASTYERLCLFIVAICTTENSSHQPFTRSGNVSMHMYICISYDCTELHVMKI